MRILQVSSAATLGGGETHVLELTAELRRRGHEVVIAGRKGSPVNPEITFPFRNAADLQTIIGLRRHVRRLGPDIVHAHVARDYPVVAAALWRQPAPRLVLTRHLLYRVQQNPLYRRVDGWLAPTAQILESVSGLRPKAGAVIPNWVDTAKFAYRPKPLRSPVVVGLLGQISPHKGHDDAIEAMRRLGAGFRLIIAGKGEAAYVDELKSKSSGLPVTFAGFVSLPEFHEMIDVQIVPSWEEPFGIVLLEAMATGIPVVSTEAGGPREILKDGVTGWLVPPRSPASLATALQAVAAHPDLRSITDAARLEVDERYEIRKTVQRIEDFYARLVSGS